MKKHIGSIAIVSVTAPWRRSRRCPASSSPGTRSPDGSGVRTLHELQCDPFGVILDRGSHAPRAEGLQPARAAAGEPAGSWPCGVSLPQARDEAPGVGPLFVRYGSPGTRPSE